MGTFQARTAMLQDSIGGGKLIGKVTFDQIYAKYQHERLDLEHDDGTAKYLAIPLMEHGPGVFASIARNVFRGNLQNAMIRGTETVARAAAKRAPTEMIHLSKSDAVKVYDRGRIIYDRPPAARRLTDKQIEALRGGDGRGRAVR